MACGMDVGNHFYRAEVLQLTNTQLIEIGIGAVALIFSIVALVFIFRTRVKVSRMQATSTSTVKEAAQLASPEGTTVELYATA